MEDSIGVLSEKVRAIHRCVVTEKSRAVYSGLSSRFVLWLAQNNPSVVQPAFLSKLLNIRDEDQRREEVIRCLLSPSPVQELPLLFDQIKSKDIELWIASLTKKDGSEPSKAYFSSARSSVFDLYRTFDRHIPSEVQEKLKNFFKGVKRTVTHLQSIGEAEIREGKLPLEYSLYQFLGSTMLSRSNQDESGVYLHRTDYILLLMPT